MSFFFQRQIFSNLFKTKLLKTNFYCGNVHFDFFLIHIYYCVHAYFTFMTAALLFGSEILLSIKQTLHCVLWHLITIKVIINAPIYWGQVSSTSTEGNLPIFTCRRPTDAIKCPVGTISCDFCFCFLLQDRLKGREMCRYRSYLKANEWNMSAHRIQLWHRNTNWLSDNRSTLKVPGSVYTPGRPSILLQATLCFHVVSNNWAGLTETGESRHDIKK